MDQEAGSRLHPLHTLISQPALQELSGGSFQFGSIEEPRLKAKLIVDANNEQLFEVSLTLDKHFITSLLGRDGLHFNELSCNRAIGARLVAAVATKPELDLGINLPEFPQTCRYLPVFSKCRCAQSSRSWKISVCSRML